MATEVLCRRLSKMYLLNRVASAALVSQYNRRMLTSGEVSTALRPFYFSVHPDLFGQHPSERTVNENSLKVLSSYIESIQQNRAVRPQTLKFFLRPQAGENPGQGLKTVNIRLGGRDVRKTVVTILSECKLPTTYVDSISKESSGGGKRRREPGPTSSHPQWAPTEEDDTGMFYDMREAVSKAKQARSLLTFLKDNSESARTRLEACQPVREQVARLQEELCQRLGLTSVLWDCGWNITHFRGCLLSFTALASQHQDAMNILRGRTLVFGNDTGVSRDGHILLNSGEVRHNWLDFIKNIAKQDRALENVPGFERAVSRVLRDIQVVRRKFQPKTTANQYHKCLRRLITSLSDFQGRQGYPRSWPQSLSQYQLVVETEAGPLMLSPTGQFIVPCSCPAFLLVNFITDNLDRASHLLHEYRSHKDVEERLHEQCLQQLELGSLAKDDCITPKLMISFCQQLLLHSSQLKPLLSGAHLAVTNYYSVMSDGQICVPWDFKLLPSAQAQ